MAQTHPKTGKKRIWVRTHSLSGRRILAQQRRAGSRFIEPTSSLARSQNAIAATLW